MRVRETIPDAVVARADEVVLVDLTPEALLERLRAGKVYPPERIDAALNNFFRIENLSALREVALRQVAQEVGAKRRPSEVVSSREESLAEGTPQAVGERLLALVEPYPGAQRLVRRAWRSAQRLNADLDLLWVRRPGRRLRGGQRALADRAATAGGDTGGEDVRGGIRRRRRQRWPTSQRGRAPPTSCSGAPVPRGASGASAPRCPSA